MAKLAESQRLEGTPDTQRLLQHWRHHKFTDVRRLLLPDRGCGNRAVVCRLQILPDSQVSSRHTRNGSGHRGSRLGTCGIASMTHDAGFADIWSWPGTSI